jgi:hypothetical protein
MVNRFSLPLLGSRILAAALSECLPGMTILALEEAFGGFYCDFSFLHPFATEILSQLEERIRQIAREKREIRSMEMVPFSASEFLKKSGQKQRASQVLSQDGFVRLIQMGSFVDWCEGCCGSHSGEAGVIRLLDIQDLGRGRYRIFGMAALSKDELKLRIRQWKRFQSLDHEKRGAEMEWWDKADKERVWLAKGLLARRQISDFWRKKISPIALEAEGNEGFHQLLSARKGNIPIMQFVSCDQCSPAVRGLLDQKKSLTIQVNSFADNERNCISFLQIVHHSLTISGFTFRIRYFGKKRNVGLLDGALAQLEWKADERGESGEPRLEFLVRDSLQCDWVVAAVQEMHRKRSVGLTVWVERNLALLLENKMSLDQLSAN